MELKGIPASNGIAIAKLYKLDHTELIIEKTFTNNPESEMAKLEEAVKVSQQELEIIRDKTLEKMDKEHADIFEAHIQIINDPELLNSVKEKVTAEQINVAYAYEEVINNYVAMFESMDSDYMKERVADIRDVSKRVLSHVLGVKIRDPSLIDEEVIVVADDLTPSDTAQLNKEYVRGFITKSGGRTSHSAIMARTLEIPAIVGCKRILANTRDGDMVILDGLCGDVFINPSSDLIKEYEIKARDYEDKKAVLKGLKDTSTATADGHYIELSANIGSPADINGVLNNGGEGIGLYRTEFLYMKRDTFPTEDEQYVAYRKVLEDLNDRPVVIRTLDIGGDKELSYLEMPKELNPFLGYRAIRMCLDRTELFKTQLRALLRASIHGNLKIMFPMIATLNEFRKAKEMLLETKAELKAEGIKVSEDIEVGIMVEVPATAVLAHKFAKEVDFFSIGTNDLIQYTFAADRMNESVSYLYQPYNPSLLHLIKMVINAAHNEGRWVGMCGEMAGDQMAIPLLLGLGLDELSMSATSILPARYLISNLNREKMKELAEKALQMDTNEAVMKLVEDYMAGAKIY